jgi:hypothetical protein
MCEDPLEDTEATLIVEIGDRQQADLAAAIEAAGGTVEATLQFDSLRVTAPETAVADICAVTGIASVTTDNAVGIGGDAGEDLGDGA